MRGERVDVVVVGGGVTGCGVALDAVTRGLSVALVEQRDFAAGTSSRSGKLVHGGLRYMEHLQFGLVRESLRERALLLRRLCPHLVKPMRFLYLLEHRVWERAYLGAGLALYDTLGGAGAVPRHRHLSRGATRRVAPALLPDAMTGAVSFYDTQCDDARHTLMVARTAAAHGAAVATGARVTGFTRSGERITGVEVTDLEGGTDFAIEAGHVVNAAGVWTDGLQERIGGRGQFHVRASKGVHVVVPRDRIDAAAAFVVRAEREPQLFVRPWNDGAYWMFGTTDTPWNLGLDDPAVTADDIDYLLRNVNRVLRRPLERADVVGAFAGLRPLVAGATDETSRLSREHAVASPVRGLTVVAGGKYTTYRVMARDAVDALAPDLDRAVGSSRTEHVPLVGAHGYAELWASRERLARESGLGVGAIEHLLNRHGGLTGDLLALVRDAPDLGAPLAGAPGYLRAEARYAAAEEGALHLEDVLDRRLRASIETADRGRAAADDAAVLAGDALGWDAATRQSEAERYRRRAEAELAGEQEHDDAAAHALVRDARASRLTATSTKE